MTEEITTTKRFYNSDKTGYVDLTNFSTNPDTRVYIINDFKVTLELNNNRKIILDYNNGEHKKEGFNGKIVRIDPESTILSEEEKMETFIKLGNLIAETFVQFYRSRQFIEGTRLLKMAADEFLGKEKAENILLNNYLKSVNEAVSNYTEKTKTNFRKIIIDSYEVINNVLGSSITDKFKHDPKDFIIKSLEDNYRYNPVITENFLTLSR